MAMCLDRERQCTALGKTIEPGSRGRHFKTDAVQEAVVNSQRNRKTRPIKRQLTTRMRARTTVMAA